MLPIFPPIFLVGWLERFSTCPAEKRKGEKFWKNGNILIIFQLSTTIFGVLAETLDRIAKTAFYVYKDLFSWMKN